MVVVCNYIEMELGKLKLSTDFSFISVLTIRNMYKGSEPMGRLHSVQKHMANVYLPLQFKEVKCNISP